MTIEERLEALEARVKNLEAKLEAQHAEMLQRTNPGAISRELANRRIALHG